MRTYSILVVDDENEIAQIIKNYLSLYKPFEKIVIAEDGIQAMQKFSNQDFDLVITDLFMEKRDGLALIDTLRKIPKHFNLKIMIVSGCMSKESTMAAMKRGIKHIVVKPFTAKQILSKAFEALKLEEFPDIKAEEIVLRAAMRIKEQQTKE